MADFPFPLPAASAIAEHRRACQNPGLLFERYTGYEANWSLEPDRHTQANPRFGALQVVCDCRCDEELLAAFASRWQAMLAAQGALTLEMQPEGRFVVGLGRKGPLEVGMTFHRIHGFPLIPGSSLKGLARAYAELVIQAAPTELLRVFGVAPEEGEDESAAHVGRAVFFDAIPVAPPALEIDVMNPHYSEYYQGGQSPKPPADYLRPIPIPFLTVGPASRYLFAVAGAEKVLAMNWLQGGLKAMGSGAKTSAGYGYWTAAAATSAPPPARAEGQPARQAEPRHEPPPTPIPAAQRPRRVADLKAGMLLTGRVRQVRDFGAFVDIGVGRDGLVHISELADRRVARVEEVVQVGQEVTVRVKSVDTVQNRIALSMKGVAQN